MWYFDSSQIINTIHQDGNLFISLTRLTIVAMILGLQSKDSSSKSGGATPKTSFLSSLNPSRWGRSSTSMPERPPPPKASQKQPWAVLQVNQDVLPKVTSPIFPSNKEKIKIWVRDKGV